jgi:hypothetical protein
MDRFLGSTILSSAVVLVGVRGHVGVPIVRSVQEEQWKVENRETSHELGDGCTTVVTSNRRH